MFRFLRNDKHCSFIYYNKKSTTECSALVICSQKFYNEITRTSILLFFAIHSSVSFAAQTGYCEP